MSERIDLVIFDCDGVLVDSERLAVRVEAELLTELGWPLTEAEVLDLFVGRSDQHMIDQVERQLGRPAPDFTKLYRERLFEAFETELTPVPGVIETLDTLEALPVRTCIASSGTHEKMARTLGRTELYDRFDGRIFSATEVSEGKPAPDLFLFAAAEMGVSPKHCAVIEDSRSGAEAARAAGMRCFGFAGGLTPADWLAGPSTVVFDDMTSLPSLLAESAGSAQAH